MAVPDYVEGVTIGGGTSVTLDLTGREVGDLLWIVYTSNGALSDPTGWTNATGNVQWPNGASFGAMFYRVVDGTETSPVVVSGAGASDRWISFGIANANQDYSTDAPAAGTGLRTADVQTFDPPSVTPGTAGAGVLHTVFIPVWRNGGNKAVSPSTGYERVTQSASGTGSTDLCADLFVEEIEISTSEDPDTLTYTEGWTAYRIGGNTVAFLTPLPVPEAPTNLTLKARGNGVSLGWTDNSTDETGFKVERSPNGSDSWSLLTTTAANVTSYTDSTAVKGATYYYRVSSTNANGDSSYATGSLEYVVGGGPAPAPPPDTDPGGGTGPSASPSPHQVQSGVYTFVGYQNILNSFYQKRMKEEREIRSAEGGGNA